MSKNYNKITGQNEQSQRAFNNIKMLYINAILDNNEQRQYQSISKLIKSANKLNIKISSSYEAEYKKLQKNFKKTKAYKQNSAIIKNIYKQNNNIVILISKTINKKDIKYIQWNTKDTYKNIYDIKAILDKKQLKTISISQAKKIRLSQYEKDTVRIVVTDVKPIYSSIKIQKNKVLIAYKQPPMKKRKIISTSRVNKIATKKPVKNSILKSKIIVIDAGHGGKDSGAIGYRKLKEKDIALSVSKMLYQELKNQGYKKVYLTRKKDVFIGLRERTKFANRKKADIFVSIHANSAHKSAEGIETYFLSPARNERAKKASAKENTKAVKHLNYFSKNTLLNVLSKPNLVASEKLAIDIHRYMKYSIKQEVSSVKDHGVRSGPFWVLVGAQMPSVLIEMGYITNKKESRRLKSKPYQRLIATGVARGITGYFNKNK